MGQPHPLSSASTSSAPSYHPSGLTSLPVHVAFFSGFFVQSSTLYSLFVMSLTQLILATCLLPGTLDRLESRLTTSHFSEDHTRCRGQCSFSLCCHTFYLSHHLNDVACVAMGSCPCPFRSFSYAIPSWEGFAILLHGKDKLSHFTGRTFLCWPSARIHIVSPVLSIKVR